MMIILSVVVLLILIAITITSIVLYYECKKPKRRKSDIPSSGYDYL